MKSTPALLPSSRLRGEVKFDVDTRFGNASTYRNPALVWYVMVKGSYRPVDRILILFSLVYLAYPISAFFAHPDWHTAPVKTLLPDFLAEPAYITMMLGLLARWDVVLGCVVTDVVAFFIVVACAATLFKSGHGEINDAAEVAVALKPFAGRFASFLFGVGLVNASLLSADILPLATAYNMRDRVLSRVWSSILR